MSELEKIKCAKEFMDKLAYGINPLDDTPIPEGDITHNVHLSRCFFYVSELLQQEIERESRKTHKAERIPFFITHDDLSCFEYSESPISLTVLTRKINSMAGDLDAKNMSRLSYRQIAQWLLDVGMLEWRSWGDKHKRFPTLEGEQIGLTLVMWENYGRRNPVVCFSEQAQRFVVDHIDAIIAMDLKKKEEFEGSSDQE